MYYLYLNEYQQYVISPNFVFSYCRCFIVFTFATSLKSIHVLIWLLDQE